MIKRILLPLLLVSFCIMTTSLSVQAVGKDILGPGADCGGNNGTGSSAVCTDTSTVDSTANPIVDRLQKITLIIAFVAGAAAILIILVSSIRYITSAGDSNQISSAKNAIIYALVGIIVIVLATSIIEFVFSRIK
jgi:hypothetical protein